jgi:hypothetical protein
MSLFSVRTEELLRQQVGVFLRGNPSYTLLRDYALSQAIVVPAMELFKAELTIIHAHEQAQTQTDVENKYKQRQIQEDLSQTDHDGREEQQDRAQHDAFIVEQSRLQQHIRTLTTQIAEQRVHLSILRTQNSSAQARQRLFEQNLQTLTTSMDEKKARLTQLQSQQHEHNHPTTNVPTNTREHGHPAASGPVHTHEHEHRAANTPVNTNEHGHPAANAPVNTHGHTEPTPQAIHEEIAYLRNTLAGDEITLHRLQQELNLLKEKLNEEATLHRLLVSNESTLQSSEQQLATEIRNNDVAEQQREARNTQRRIRNEERAARRQARQMPQDPNLEQLSIQNRQNLEREKQTAFSRLDDKKQQLIVAGNNISYTSYLDVLLEQLPIMSFSDAEKTTLRTIAQLMQQHLREKEQERQTRETLKQYEYQSQRQSSAHHADSQQRLDTHDRQASSQLDNAKKTLERLTKTLAHNQQEVSIAHLKTPNFRTANELLRKETDTLKKQRSRLQFRFNLSLTIGLLALVGIAGFFVALPIALPITAIVVAAIGLSGAGYISSVLYRLNGKIALNQQNISHNELLIQFEELDNPELVRQIEKQQTYIPALERQLKETRTALEESTQSSQVAMDRQQQERKKELEAKIQTHVTTAASSLAEARRLAPAPLNTASLHQDGIFANRSVIHEPNLEFDTSANASARFPL